MVGVIVAAGVSLAWAVIAPRSSPARMIVDTPDGVLKVHDRPIPPIGGIGVFLGLHLGLASEGEFDVVFLVAGAIILGLGLVDDLRGVPPVIRLAVETIGGVVLLASPHLDVDVLRGIVVVGAVLVAVNGINLIDGMDGLAGSVVIITAVGIGVVSGEVGAFVLAAALAGFLVRNWHPARLFLGDNGAYLIGFSIVYLGARSADGALGLMAASAMLGVVLIDLAITVIRRARSGNSLFAGDRSHVYDQMTGRGVAIPRIVMMFVVVQVAIVGTVTAAVVAYGAGAGVITAVVVGGGFLAAAWAVGLVTPR